MDLALNNLQSLICHITKLNQTKLDIKSKIFSFIAVFPNLFFLDAHFCGQKILFCVSANRNLK